MIDVSHTVELGMVTYKGLPVPVICDFLTREASRASYAPGTEFYIGKIEMVANTGTYVNSPFHRYSQRRISPRSRWESLANLDCVVARVPSSHAGAIDRLGLTEADVRGRAVLVHTGWDRHWGSERYCEGHPYLTGELAEWLVRAGAVLVGIDSLNIDGIATRERPVHSVLLGHEVPVVEHLTGLEALPDRGSRFFAVPVKVKSFGTFPVRAFALV
jgi:arylformamidase